MRSKRIFDGFVVTVSALDVKRLVNCLTETWLNENCDTHCFKIHVLKLIACNRETKRRRSCNLHTKNIKGQKVSSYRNNFRQILSLQLKIKNRSLLIINTYMKPNTPIKVYRSTSKLPRES